MSGKKQLTFRRDGTFTIAQFTDVHWMNGNEQDARSRDLMERIIREERPDLIVYTGDVIYTGAVREGEQPCVDAEGAFRDAVACAEEAGIPWAVVFGNHDTENLITREELGLVVESCAHAVSGRGPESVPGTGNFTLVLEDRSGAPAAALFGFDSGAYSDNERVPGYDWIKRGQIDWYVAESGRLAAANGGERLPALAFFHIPLPEYRQAWDTVTCYGEKHEDVCCSQLNGGLFAAMVETGDVMGTFCGHDHINDFWGELHGIRLCYGRASGYHTYGREGFVRGARMIRLREGERGFDTWLRLHDGTVAASQPEHVPDPR
ncbi:metallophosphoesterase family protein [Paenibacillus hodogayensis]|uniref:Metallophosphoesterase family protein n=1 Tax=Paenibacillus hodogayensis TaxID=279208 RepID=A0ABV5VQS1_9BACL